MNYFVFLAGRSNITNFNVVCSLFKIPEDIQSRGRNFFLNPPGKYYSLVLNSDTFELTVIDPNYKVVSKDSNKAQQLFTSKSQIIDQLNNVLKPFPNGAQLYAFATFLVNNLPQDLITSDLSIKGTGKQKRKRLSLIDYINVVCSESTPVSKAMKALHQFIQSQVTIPKLFINNVQMVQ
jgi:hypothetical protein